MAERGPDLSIALGIIDVFTRVSGLLVFAFVFYAWGRIDPVWASLMLVSGALLASSGVSRGWVSRDVEGLVASAARSMAAGLILVNGMGVHPVVKAAAVYGVTGGVAAAVLAAFVAGERLAEYVGLCESAE